MLMRVIAFEYPALPTLAASASALASIPASFRSFLYDTFDLKSESEWATLQGLRISSNVIQDEKQISVISAVWDEPLLSIAVATPKRNLVVIRELTNDATAAVVAPNFESNDVNEVDGGSCFDCHAAGALL